MTQEVNIFEAPAIPSSPEGDVEQTGSYLENLVGEGKKFKDTEALAKGKIEADNYVKTLERKADELAKELSTRLSLEEFLKTSKQTPPTNTNGASNNSTPSGNERPASVEESTHGTLTKEEIASLVRDALSQEQTKASRSKNLQEAQKVLLDTWGPRAYAEKMDDAVNRLGLGKEFLADIAARSPQAFIELVGAKKDATTGMRNSNPPVSTQRVSDDGYNPNVRNQVWWERFRKDNPKEYFNEANTVKRHKDASAMGGAFFNKR